MFNYPITGARIFTAKALTSSIRIWIFLGNGGMSLAGTITLGIAVTSSMISDRQ